LNIIGADTAEAVKGALARGVRYRTILDSYSDVNLIRQMSALLDDENFEVRSVKMPLKINVAIFDSKEASLNFYPSKSISDSPMLWTNHPSLLVSFQAQFENEWTSAERIY
jgi:hypothetical protein